MDFSLALALLRQGHSIQRTGWYSTGLTLHLQNPDAQSKMTLPYIYMHFPEGEKVPWLPSQMDVLGNDWAIAAPAKATVDLIRLPVVSAPQTAQEPAKRRGRPKGSTAAKTARVVDPDAPYGRKLNGTPKAPPGRKKAEPSAPAAPAA
jgi:hypothetical protein